MKLFILILSIFSLNSFAMESHEESIVNDYQKHKEYILKHIAEPRGFFAEERGIVTSRDYERALNNITDKFKKLNDKDRLELSAKAIDKLKSLLKYDDNQWDMKLEIIQLQAVVHLQDLAKSDGFDFDLEDVQTYIEVFKIIAYPYWSEVKSMRELKKHQIVANQNRIFVIGNENFKKCIENNKDIKITSNLLDRFYFLDLLIKTKNKYEEIEISLSEDNKDEIFISKDTDIGNLLGYDFNSLALKNAEHDAIESVLNDTPHVITEIIKKLTITKSEFKNAETLFYSTIELRNFGSLVELNLSENNITKESLNGLSARLKEHKNIKVLNLAKNKIILETNQEILAKYKDKSDDFHNERGKVLKDMEKGMNFLINILRLPLSRLDLSDNNVFYALIDYYNKSVNYSKNYSKKFLDLLSDKLEYLHIKNNKHSFFEEQINSEEKLNNFIQYCSNFSLKELDITYLKNGENLFLKYKDHFNSK